MHRLSPVLALWVAASWLVPAVGVAQTEGNISIFKNDEQISNTMNVLFISGADCDEEDDTITFRLRLQSQSSNLRNSLLQVWTSNSGQDCVSASGRMDPEGNNCNNAPCVLRTTQNIIDPDEDLEIELPTTQLFEGDTEGKCQEGGSMKVTFVAVNGENCSSPAENLFADPFNATFEMRTRAAPIPRNASATDGDNSIRISWDEAGGEARDEYTVYFDTNPGDRCSNTVLESELSATQADDLDVESRVTGSTSTRISTADFDLEIDDYVAAAISTEDVAGNRSDLSEVVCGRRVVTENVVDRIENDTGESIKTCSSTSSPSSGSLVPVTWLLLLAFAGRRYARGSRA